MDKFILSTARELISRYRRGLIIAVHIVMIAGAYFIGYLLRFEFEIPHESAVTFYGTLPFLIVIKLFVFYFFGLFSGLWRYVSFEDLWQILKANVSATLVFVSVIWVVFGFTGFPRSVFILDWILCVGFMGGIRLITREIRKLRQSVPNRRKKRVLIVGAGEAGILVLNELRRNTRGGFEIVGFIDCDPRKLGNTIHGVKVLGDRTKIQEVVERRYVEEIIIAIPSAKGEAIRDILSYCELPGVRIKVIPGFQKFLSGDLVVKPRDVRPEDLLGRAQAEVDEASIGAYLAGKRVLVTGAGGSIGSELCRQIARFKPEGLVFFDHNENDVYFLAVELRLKYPQIQLRTVIGDIRDVGLLKNTFTRHKPQVLFHAAAHKHVPLMEENPASAVKNNIIGTRNLVYAANHYRLERFVLISTDKAVNPSSVMGMSKRIAEMILQNKARLSRTKYMAVRFGNVLGSAGSVVPLFKKQIEDGGPLTITDPQVKRYFMSVSEAAALVLQAGALGRGGEIFVLDMGDPIKIVDIARNLVAFSGLKFEEDLSVRYTGLRPGEKLSEDLLLSAEKDRTTRHKKIFVVSLPEVADLKLRYHITELDRLARHMDADKIIRRMSQIVRESS